MTRDEAFAHFLAAWPAYRDTTRLDDLRAREYGRLDATGTCISMTRAAVPRSRVARR